MGDASWIDKGFRQGLDNMNRRVDRATMYALRAGGRAVKQEARKRAPVYQERRFNKETLKFEAKGTSYRRMRSEVRAGTRTEIGKNEVVAGLLKNSISSSRKLKTIPGGYSLKVGPRGDRVHLYAGKIEAMRPYMRPGREAAAARLPEICAKAWARAIK